MDRKGTVEDEESCEDPRPSNTRQINCQSFGLVFREISSADSSSSMIDATKSMVAVASDMVASIINSLPA